MFRSKFRFLFILIVLVALFHFFASPLRNTLVLVTGKDPHSSFQSVTENLVSNLKKSFQHTKRSVNKMPKPVMQPQRVEKLVPSILAENTQEVADFLSNDEESSSLTDNSFLQITLEEERPSSLHHAEWEDSEEKLVLALLAHYRQRNTEILQETGLLFGDETKQEIASILLEDEKRSLQNAKASETFEMFLTNQQVIDEETEKYIREILEKNKKFFKEKHSDKSPAWQTFFHRLDNFNRAAELTKQQ